MKFEDYEIKNRVLGVDTVDLNGAHVPVDFLPTAEIFMVRPPESSRRPAPALENPEAFDSRGSLN